MTPVLVAVAFVGSGVAVGLLCFPLRAELLRRHFIDHPNARSSHQIPTPRGGGIAIMAAVVLGFLLVGIFRGGVLPIVLSLCSLFLAGISLLDDFKPLPARVRFAGHALAAIIVLAVLILPRRSEISAEGGWLFYAGPILFLWIVGYTNAFNFMDGINGIAAGQAIITSIGTLLVVGLQKGNWAEPVQVCAALIAGSAAGFLPHNFPRARMFMGDVGSAPLGFLLASIVLWSAATYGWVLLCPLVLLHTNYILDTSITLARRFLRGERVYEAHKEHFYQRLVRSGKSHVFTTGWEMLLQTVTVGLVLLWFVAGIVGRVAILTVVPLIWLCFFGYVEVLFRQSASRSIPSLSAAKPLHA